MRKLAAPIAVILSVLTTAVSAEALLGWTFSSTQAACFSSQLEQQVVHGGRKAACLQSIAVPGAEDFATVTQAIDARLYRGQKVKLSGFVRSDKVTQWAGLWMRIDPKSGPPLEFDNMQKRPIRGTTEWTQYSIELNVSFQAEQIHIGGLLMGSGTIWLDDLKLETVGAALVGVREKTRLRSLPLRPVNMDFEK